MAKIDRAPKTSAPRRSYSVTKYGQGTKRQRITGFHFHTRYDTNGFEQKIWPARSAAGKIVRTKKSRFLCGIRDSRTAAQFSGCLLNRSVIDAAEELRIRFSLDPEQVDRELALEFDPSREFLSAFEFHIFNSKSPI